MECLYMLVTSSDNWEGIDGGDGDAHIKIDIATSRSYKRYKT